jgi:uncharacterized protein YecE (DUF72 family)
LYIGTSGYYFDDWIGAVYPEKISRSAMIKYYSAVWKFNAVELNFTYYGLPGYKTIVSMVRKTPSSLVFSVKVPGSITHEGWKNSHFPREDIKFLLNALEPMILEKRLKVLLAQFPYSFTYSKENVDYLKKIRDTSTIPIAIEFRHKSWNTDDVYRFLEENEMCYVIVDEPQIRNLFPYRPLKTSDISYFRFHGRNSKWFVSSSERYNYDYSEEELELFKIDIEKLLRKSLDTFVFFNNCYRGKAVKNAIKLRSMIDNSFFGGYFFQ